MSQIVIRAVASLSSLGHTPGEIVSAYSDGLSRMVKRKFREGERWVAPLPVTAEQALQDFTEQHPVLKHADRSVAMAVFAAEQAFFKTGWDNEVPVLVNAGSSRGATGLWEQYYENYLEHRPLAIRTSPTTTLGNIATHVAQHLQLNAAAIDHSITCGSGLQAVANGMAWLRSGMCRRVMAVATESALTGFTIEQMAALGVYSRLENDFPCQPFGAGPEISNTMVLGEAAVALCMELTDAPAPGDIVIGGIGFGQEQIASLTSIDRQGKGFRHSMQNAMIHAGVTGPGLILAHAPGTIKGDAAEEFAIRTLFSDHLPPVISNKWLCGHTFGTSGMMSIETGIYLLKENLTIRLPYASRFSTAIPGRSDILVNAMGFGGNAISVLLQKV